jgi:Protein of unknown function DUF2834
MKPILALVFLAFGVYSAYAIFELGYLGVFSSSFANAGTLQVFLDLVIACLLILTWLVRDARDKGRNPWPYVVLTLAAGSFGPLLYLLLADRRTSAAPQGS